MGRSSACRHGANKRRLLDRRCAECHADRNKAYYRKNREAILAKAQKQRDYVAALIAADKKG
jgi:hypothetical protein